MMYENLRERISKMMVKFLKMHVELCKGVVQLEIDILYLKDELSVKVEDCDAQHQRVVDIDFELVSMGDEIKIDFEELMGICKSTIQR